VDTINKILFRLLIVYSVVVLVLVLPIALGTPWDRGAWEVDSRPSRPVDWQSCVVVDAVDAKRQAHDLREELATRDSPRPGFRGALADQRDRECIEFYERLAAWYEQATPNWRSSHYWRASVYNTGLFVLPAWLLWGIIRWAILGPLRARGGE
jgi:hypothetical protein